MSAVHLTVNGRTYAVEADPQTSLLTILREHLDLIGTKYGCGEGQCGACTVLVNGKAQRSCITKVASVAQKEITTIEGLASREELHPVQQAFLDEGALQCGYCTPGMIISAVALLRQNPHPAENDIVEFMNGNICRCGTYPRIIKAIHRAAKMGTNSAARLRSGPSAEKGVER
jgi:aerobic-type carbon monoxide dehydrogenase small subunit (CoxS/CutS family)